MKKETIIMFILAALFCALMAFSFSSCNPAAKLARQTEKAKQLVISDSAAFRQVGMKFLQLNPCVNLITYKSDTTYHHDTTEMTYIVHDTLRHIDTVFLTRTLHVTQTIHDTIQVIDDQQLNLLNETVQARNIQISGMNQQITDAHAATVAAQSLANKRAWWLYGSWGTVLLAIFGWGCVKLFSPAGAATGIISKIKI